MAIEIQDLSALDPTVVDSATALMTQLLQEYIPTVDLKRGAVQSLVLHLSAILGAANQVNWTQVQQAMTIAGIESNPALADPTLVDAVFSNFRVTRKVGTPAVGSVTIVLNRQSATTIAAGTTFTSGSLVFVTKVPYAARLSAADVQSDTDRVLTAGGDGTYSFDVDVEATAAGPDYRIQKNTVLAVSPQPPHFVTAYAAADFDDGYATETNEQVVARFAEGVAAKAWSNRLNITAMLRDQVDFANILAASIIGFGDPETTRDQHSLLPISYGGRSDLYVRTQELPRAVDVTVTATLIDKAAAGSLWQFAVERDALPGCYEVAKIRATDANPTNAGYEVTATARGFDLSDVGDAPDVETAKEAAFSRFQTLHVQFLDTDVDTTTLTVNAATRDYVVTLYGMPLIEDLQVFCSDRGVTDPAGDVLVRAPIPCFLTVNFTIATRPGDAAPAVDSIKTAAARVVNNIGFTGRLDASVITDVVQGMLTGKSTVGPIDMFGRILLPGGTYRTIRSDQSLTIPRDYAESLSGRTCAFILDPRNIGVTVVAADVLEV